MLTSSKTAILLMFFPMHPGCAYRALDAARRARSTSLVCVALPFASRSFHAKMCGQTFLKDRRNKQCFILCWLAVMRLQPRSAGTHQRSILFPCGNKNYGFVRSGNRLASRFCLVMWYCLALGHVFLLEQPHGSMCELHPRMEMIFAVCCVFKCGIWGGLYALDRSEASPKRHVLYSNDEKLLHELTLAAGHMTKEDMASFDGPALVKRQKREDGGESWTGVPGVLTKSQLGAYGAASSIFLT